MTSSSTLEGTQTLFLPDAAITSEGFEYSPSSDVWLLVDLGAKTSMNFAKISSRVTPEFMAEFKYVMIWYLRNKSAAHARNVFNLFTYFLLQIPNNLLPVGRITTNDLINFKGQLTKHTEWHLGVISGLLKKWHALGLDAVDGNAIKFLEQITIKGNSKGDAVRSMDPVNGPYTDLELQAIYSALNGSYAQGNLVIEDYLLVILIIILGVRPIQLAALKIEDFVVVRNSDGAAAYILNIPRAKQRGSISRQEFRSRPLIPEIGKVLEAWIHAVRKNCDQNCGKPMKLDALPIFPCWNNLMPPGYEHHSTAQMIGELVKKICNDLSVLSERTGVYLKITPRRFRHTMGTRAAEEGHGELIIADLLDHTDTQNVGVYVEATPAIAARIDKATAMELAPIAQAFMGLIVNDETQAMRGNDPSSRIGRPDVGNIGSCGKYGFCGGMAPIACYTCHNFQPWLDAPHEQLLDALLSDRARTLEITGDERIASVNDRTIIAMADVVTQCKELASMEDDDNG